MPNDPYFPKSNGTAPDPYFPQQQPGVGPHMEPAAPIPASPAQTMPSDQPKQAFPAMPANPGWGGSGQPAVPVTPGQGSPAPTTVPMPPSGAPTIAMPQTPLAPPGKVGG
ncbi:MAG TPA: hypothetical protein VMN56_03540 [Casimicrobiaceae bacterium]|nr:hypothetical protein [Casimicrobiaceae bacterium]